MPSLARACDACDGTGYRADVRELVVRGLQPAGADAADPRRGRGAVARRGAGRAAARRRRVARPGLPPARPARPQPLGWRGAAPAAVPRARQGVAHADAVHPRRADARACTRPTSSASRRSSTAWSTRATASSSWSTTRRCSPGATRSSSWARAAARTAAGSSRPGRPTRSPASTRRPRRTSGRCSRDGRCCRPGRRRRLGSRAAPPRRPLALVPPARPDGAARRPGRRPRGRRPRSPPRRRAGGGAGRRADRRPRPAGDDVGPLPGGLPRVRPLDAGRRGGRRGDARPPEARRLVPARRVPPRHGGPPLLDDAAPDRAPAARPGRRRLRDRRAR